MDLLNKYLQTTIQLEISGKKNICGILLEIGSDIIVVYDGENFLYIPSNHIQNIKENNDEEITMKDQSFETTDSISLRKILLNAKGIFSEIFVTGSQSIHGYVTSILNDYFVFYSPVYKTMFIPFQHLKWLIPYQGNQTPYALDKEMLPVNPMDIHLSRTFIIQLRKFIGKIIILDLGLTSYKIGQLKSINGNLLELVTARQELVYINLNHIKTVHFQ